MAGQTLGVIDIVWRGTALDVEKGAKIKLGGWKQNPVLVQGKTKYAREYEASEITCTSVVNRGQDIPGLFAGGEGELQCNCDSGQSFIFSDAFLVNRPDMTGDAAGGKLEMKWAAGEPETLLNG